MKYLADACVSIHVFEALRARGHDVGWIGDDKDPGDDEVLARASAEGRILITLDKDFGQLAILQGAPHNGIVRIVDIRVLEQAHRLLKAFADYEADLRAGAIVTIEPSRTRIRPP